MYMYDLIYFIYHVHVRLNAIYYRLYSTTPDI